MRATYRRLQGVEHFLGFYDVHADVLDGVFSPRKRIVDLLPAFARLRRCYPHRRLFVVLDNLHNVHDHPRFLRGLRRMRIRPLFVPTDASWLNLIEAQFGVLRRFTLAGTDDRTHAERRDRVYRFLRLRHLKRRNASHPLTRLHLLRSFKLGQH